MSDRKYKLLVIYDVHVDSPGGRLYWAYGRRALALQKYSPPDFDVDICCTNEIPWGTIANYDCVFQIEYAAPQYRRFKKLSRAPMVVSYNSDARRRQEYWPRAYHESDFLLCNNAEVFEDHNRQPHTCCISNGVDTDIFKPNTPIAEREHLCVFAGSTGPTKMKGWKEVFWPLEKILPEHGFTSDFRPIDDINPDVVMPTESTIYWYNSASYVLIASLSEGTPNAASEGVACGNVLVTLPVGNVLEWGRDRENCVLVQDRTPEAFLEALKYAREHRERLSAAGLKTMQDGWSYGAPGNRADYFFALFRRIINDGVRSVKPFRYDEIKPEEI